MMRAALLLLLTTVTTAFVLPQDVRTLSVALNQQVTPSDEATSQLLTRRSTLAAVGASLLVGVQSPLLASADDSVSTPVTKKVLVLGGTGFVGSRVVDLLRGSGVEVVATSRDGRDGTVALDILTTADLSDRVKTLSSGCQAVVACWGAFGTPDDGRINAASGLAAVGAKAAGVDRFVTLGVAPEVEQAISGLVSQLQPYLDGKAFSKKTISSTFGSNEAIFIEPTFIYGGDKFGLKPPRVAGFYGSFIEGLLSSAPVRFVEGILPKGNIIEVALEPPVSVDAVASAAVAGALGKLASTPILDTHDKIKSASKAL